MNTRNSPPKSCRHQSELDKHRVSNPQSERKWVLLAHREGTTELQPLARCLNSQDVVEVLATSRYLALSSRQSRGTLKRLGRRDFPFRAANRPEASMMPRKPAAFFLRSRRAASEPPRSLELEPEEENEYDQDALPSHPRLKPAGPPTEEEPLELLLEDIYAGNNRDQDVLPTPEDKENHILGPPVPESIQLEHQNLDLADDFLNFPKPIAGATPSRRPSPASTLGHFCSRTSTMNSATTTRTTSSIGGATSATSYSSAHDTGNNDNDNDTVFLMSYTDITEDWAVGPADGQREGSVQSERSIDLEETYWILDREKGRYYHIDQGPDGEEEVVWYPEEFD